MKKGFILLAVCIAFYTVSKAAFLHNDYSYLQEITFELYTDDVPAYKVPEQIKSIEESLMFEVLHATWKDKHWVSYTLNKSLLGTFKVGQPALLDNGTTKKMFFVAAFPGSVGGLDLYVSEYSNNTWSKPRNLGKGINTEKNESNPGLLNDHTLTYSSGGIIKKLDLNTLKVVDLEEANGEQPSNSQTRNSTDNRSDEVKKNNDPLAAIGDNSTATPAGNTATDKNDYGAIGDNSTAMPANTNDTKSKGQNQNAGYTEQPVEKREEMKPAPRVQQNKENTISAPVQNNTTTQTSNANSNGSSVQFLGNKTREEMLAKYKTAIQLGAFSTPKWELFDQLAKYGKIVSYKNEKNMNVVWITGFANHAAAEAVLQQVKATPGFENAYITGK